MAHVSRLTELLTTPHCLQVKMITGDHLLIAKETARQLGLGTNIEESHGLPMLEEGGAVSQ